ncbi:MAG: lipoyl(octanoyl) transferase LipB [bacterium]
MRPLEVTQLARVEYEDGLDLMDDLRAKVGAGELPDQLLLLEHPPVVTLGRNASDRHLLLSAEALARRGIGFFRTGRGGDVTFHGPGQIVGYPILDLNPDRRDVRRYVRDLEEAIIRTLADFGVGSGRIAGLTGVWVGDLKIAAIGVRISRWITSHGFAFNIATDLSYFDTMIPCGIPERGVTSLSRLLGRDVSLDEVRGPLTTRVAEVFDRAPVPRPLDTESVQTWLWRHAGESFEVLLLRRTDRAGGFWQPVTGLIEAGEAPRDAAAREVLEETGLRGDVVDLEYVRDFRIVPVGSDPPPRAGPGPWLDREHAFAMEAGEAEVALEGGEHDEYLWVDPERAKELLRWNGNRRALERLMRRLREGMPLSS